VVRGRLFETSSGIPVLQVLEKDILAVGTTDPCPDVATRARFAARMPPDSNPNRLPKNAKGTPGGSCTESFSPSTTPRPASRPSTGWRGFIPAVPAFYRRVLVPVGPTEPCFRSGSMWSGIAGTATSRSYLARSGANRPPSPPKSA